MAEMTNLTDRIAQLRERKGGSRIVGGNRPGPEEPEKAPARKKKKTRFRERKLAPDYFAIFVYTLLAFTLGVQFFLIVWLDFVL